MHVGSVDFTAVNYECTVILNLLVKSKVNKYNLKQNLFFINLVLFAVQCLHI